MRKYTHTQEVPQTEWIIQHGLDCPSIVINNESGARVTFDAYDGPLSPRGVYDEQGFTRVEFWQPFSGKATCYGQPVGS